MKDQYSTYLCKPPKRFVITPKSELKRPQIKTMWSMLHDLNLELRNKKPA